MDRDSNSGPQGFLGQTRFFLNYQHRTC